MLRLGPPRKLPRPSGNTQLSQLNGMEAGMAWLTVVAAGILEAGFAIRLKFSHGFTRLAPTPSR